MMRTVRWLLILLLLPEPAASEAHPGADAFAARAADEFGLDAAEVSALLAQAVFKESIADAIARPAEARPWHEYRPIFLTPQRIGEGIDFWRENRELIERVSAQFEVEPQVIVAIIGVETFYGRITGGYRVLDALTTLSFHYPSDRTRDRSEFFSGELMEFFLLGREEELPLDEVTGSYAGAMGLGQFMPSSYRAYAVDLDRDGRRDLWRSRADAVGSVANYLREHGWEPGGPIARRASAAPGSDLALVERGRYRPERTVMELHGLGVRSAPDLAPDRRAALLRLEEIDGASYWVTFQNFYVLTRYNRSPLYAMAVYELSEELRRGVEQS